MHTPGVPDASIDFDAASLQLAQDLERLESFARDVRLESSLPLIAGVLKRLRSHRFTVAVVGEFRTGKSTFVNALLGSELVPTDVVPTTATLNRITYGLDKRAEVRFKDGSAKPIGVADLSAFVTKQADRTLLASIDEVIVFDSSPYLMNGVDLVDTPGLDDEDAMTAVTVGALPKVDAAILVISALSPLGQHTRAFLEQNLLTVDLGRVIFLVNRIGQLGSDAEADRLVAYVQGEVHARILNKAQKQFGLDSPQFDNYRRKLGSAVVYGMDAKQALNGRVSADTALINRSRFPQFDAALRQFLTDDRGAMVLQIPVNRVIASCQEIALAVSLRRDGLKTERTAFEDQYTAHCADLDGLRGRARQELEAINAKCDEALTAALPKLSGAEGRILEAIRNHVRDRVLSEQELAMDRGVLGQTMVQSAMNLRNALAHAELDTASQGINALITDAAEGAHAFAVDVDAAVPAMSTGFPTVVPGSAPPTWPHSTSVGELLRHAGGIFAFAGYYEGYKRAGIKGAIAGGISGAGAGMLTVGLLTLVGAPLLPLAAATMAAQWFGASKAIHFLMPEAEVSRFKESVIEKIEAQIQRENTETQLRDILTQYAVHAFKGLHDILRAEAQAVLDNTQRTLDDLRDKHARHEVESDLEARTYSEMVTTVAEIAGRAQMLNQLLLKRLMPAQG